MKMLAAGLILLLVACGAQAAPPATQPADTISTGMSAQAALDAVKAVGGRTADMDMAPPPGKTLNCFELADGRVVCLVFDKQAVVEITVCDKPDAPKAEREWRKVDTLALRRQATSQPAVAFEIKCKKPEDRIDVSTEGDSMVFTVTSPTGIGEATLERKGDAWPKQVVLRLNLKGLESLLISADGAAPSSATAQGDGSVRQRVAGRAIAKDDPLWLDIQRGEGFFKIVLPKTLLKEKTKAITVNWIDFFRG